MKKSILTFIMLIATSGLLSAQDWLDSISNQSGQNNYTSATFKTTRLINFHTLETVGKRTLDFRISHRFGSVNSGSYNLWGLDGGATIRLGLEYSYDGRLMAGIGRGILKKCGMDF